MIPCSQTTGYQVFEGPYYLHIEEEIPWRWRQFFSSRTLVTRYYSTCNNIPEYDVYNQHHRKLQSAPFACYFASGQSTNCSVLSLCIKTMLLCGQNTRELALAFGVLGRTTLGLDTLHLKIKPRNKIIWPTLVQKMSIITMGCLQLVFQILWLFYLVWEVTVAATILSYLTQYMNYVPLQTKHELFKSLHMSVCASVWKKNFWDSICNCQNAKIWLFYISCTVKFP